MTTPSVPTGVTLLHHLDASRSRCMYCGMKVSRIKDLDIEPCQGSSELRDAAEAAAELLAREAPTADRLEVLRRLGHALI